MVVWQRRCLRALQCSNQRYAGPAGKGASRRRCVQQIDGAEDRACGTGSFQPTTFNWLAAQGAPAVGWVAVVVVVEVVVEEVARRGDWRVQVSSRVVAMAGW